MRCPTQSLDPGRIEMDKGAIPQPAAFPARHPILDILQAQLFRNNPGHLQHVDKIIVSQIINILLPDGIVKGAEYSSHAVPDIQIGFLLLPIP